MAAAQLYVPPFPHRSLACAPTIGIFRWKLIFNAWLRLDDPWVNLGWFATPL